MENIDARATRGASWAIIGFGSAQVLRFVGNLCLTRWIAPEAFGLMALVNATLTGLWLFSDIGLGPSVVQNARGAEPAFENTAWTIQLLRGILLFVVCCVVAYPLARLYDEPSLAWLIPAAGLSTLASSVTTIRLLAAGRDLHVREATLAELISQATGLGSTLLWAAFSPSVAALVVGGVVSAITRAGVGLLFFDGPHGSLAWDKEAVRDIVKLGKWVFLSTILTFLAGQFDRFILGLLFDFRSLGIYNLAQQLAGIPSAALSHLALAVLFPYLSSLFASGRDVRSAYLAARRPMLLLGGWAVSGLLAGGPSLVAFLYPKDFQVAGPMLQIIVFGMWFGVALEGPNGGALLARGAPRWNALCSSAKLVGMATLLPLGVWLGRMLFPAHPYAGFFGALVGLAASELLRYAMSLYAVVQIGLARPSQDFAMTIGVCVAGAIGFEAAQLFSLLELQQVLLAAGARPSIAAHVDSFGQGLVVAIVVTLIWSPWLVPMLKAKRLFNASAFETA